MKKIVKTLGIAIAFIILSVVSDLIVMKVFPNLAGYQSIIVSGFVCLPFFFLLAKAMNNIDK